MSLVYYARRTGTNGVLARALHGDDDHITDARHRAAWGLAALRLARGAPAGAGRCAEATPQNLRMRLCDVMPSPKTGACPAPGRRTRESFSGRLPDQKGVIITNCPAPSRQHPSSSGRTHAEAKPLPQQVRPEGKWGPKQAPPCHFRDQRGHRLRRDMAGRAGAGFAAGADFSGLARDGCHCPFRAANAASAGGSAAYDEAAQESR